MKYIRIFLPILVVVSIISCSAFFDSNDESKSGNNMRPLALADGSGYLSTDDYNEITPFLYRDTNSGKTWLFFSSDRGGNYDLYRAEMNTEGRFLNLQKLGTNVNTSMDEYSPLIQEEPDYNGLNYMPVISFIRASNSITQIVTLRITDLTNMTTIPVTNFIFNTTGIGQYNSLMEIAIGDTNLYMIQWNQSVTNWYTNVNTNSIPASYPIRNSCGIYHFEYFSVGAIFYQSMGTAYILDCLDNNRHQLHFSLTWAFPSLFMEGAIAVYSSAYNDRDPFIDGDTMQVYFSSDRFGKNNYDLYRYNYLTFDKVVAFPAPIPY